MTIRQQLKELRKRNPDREYRATDKMILCRLNPDYHPYAPGETSRPWLYEEPRKDAL